MKKGLFLFLFLFSTLMALATVYRVNNGTVHFHSDAPRELISASSHKLEGALDATKRTFLFRVDVTSFAGFNNPLQKEHFNENYMESDIFPLGTFSGKIIEDADLSRDGDYNIRAKGKLKIHGIEQERIIKCHVVNKGGVITVQSDFVVLLADHGIKIPRIVYDKLAPEIKVSINATLEPAR